MQSRLQQNKLSFESALSLREIRKNSGEGNFHFILFNYLREISHFLDILPHNFEQLILCRRFFRDVTGFML